ncbi:MAG: 16S rRNA (adenine(1518)-N(6)/adenine(1519)-N(6))-dimethyltransferase RsmA [Candidatus Desulfacyla sp.]
MNQRGSLQPDKRLGQHFLVDGDIPDKIISSARFRSSDGVLEIGPGQGALTLPLSRAVSSIVAVEKDIRMTDFLRKRLSASGISNITLVCQDILEFDFDAIPLPPSGKIQVMGNLPYNISSPVLKKLIHHRKRLSRAVLMFQREVAERLTAPPCTKGYGAMTLLIRYHARQTRLLEVPKSAFYPVPKVDSMVIELDFERPYPSHGVDEDDFRKAVKGAFAHRRKTLLNSLKRYLPAWEPHLLLKRLTDCGIEPSRRAETLTMDEFLTLASTLAVDKREAG